MLAGRQHSPIGTVLQESNCGTCVQLRRDDDITRKTGVDQFPATGTSPQSARKMRFRSIEGGSSSGRFRGKIVTPGSREPGNERPGSKLVLQSRSQATVAPFLTRSDDGNNGTMRQCGLHPIGRGSGVAE